MGNSARIAPIHDDVEPECPTKLDVPLHGVDAGAAGTEMDEMLAVRAADIEDGLLIETVRLADEADRPGWNEEVSKHPLRLVAGPR